MSRETKIKAGVQEVVQNLYVEHGHVQASALVDAARPKASPAHAAFEWDNKKAGEEFRLMQARKWIRVVEIVVEDQPERLVHVPRIVAADDEFACSDAGLEGSYQVPSVLVTREDEYERAMDEAQSSVRAAARSVNYLMDAKKRHLGANGRKQRMTKRDRQFTEKATAGLGLLEEALSFTR